MEGVVAGMTLGDNLLELRLDAGKVPLDSMKLTNYPITGPMFSGPQQTPFVCTTNQVGRQPLVDSASPPGYAVYDAQGNVIGYSRNCSIEHLCHLLVPHDRRRAGKPLPADGSGRPTCAA